MFIDLVISNPQTYSNFRSPSALRLAYYPPNHRRTAGSSWYEYSPQVKISGISLPKQVSEVTGRSSWLIERVGEMGKGVAILKMGSVVALMFVR